ncbi:MAG: SurA N-terminal domain-containing protein, partial [Desulfuromonadales bacterium]|nr:SurA N-terminal domain-containing protein [Desulfuromonadales bacterium]
MLDLVRNKQKSFIIKIAFAIIILSFVIGYAMMTAPGGPDNDKGREAVAVVNETAISYTDFQAAYSNLYQLYQNIYQEQFSPALERQLKLVEKTANGLIDQVLLLEEAERLGLSVSQQELVDAIAAIQAFQQEGRFSKERYLQVLAYQRLNADEFESMQRRDLLTGKVRQQIQAGSTVTDQEIEEEFRLNNDKINLEFVRLSPGLFESRVKITDENLATYFDAHQEDFRIPERVALRYLQFVPSRYAEEITFDETELEKYYRRHLDQFDVPEQIKASHILIKVEQDADQSVRDKKRAFAAELLADAKADKDFVELARTYSDDKASAVKGGDLGFFTRGTMVPAFEQAAFGMKPGEISDLVETPFGFHIIKAEAYTEAGVRSLDEALDMVKAGLREEKSRQYAFEKAMDAYNINRKTGDLQAAADANELGLKETGLFALNDTIDGIGRNEEIISAAFQLEENNLARPVMTDEGTFLFGLKERVASHIPEFDKVRVPVEGSYRKEQGKVLAETAAKELLAGLEEGKSLVKLADSKK